MNRKRFERLVEEPVATIPRRFRRAIENVAVIVEQEPPEALLDEMGIEPPGSGAEQAARPSADDDDVVLSRFRMHLLVPIRRRWRMGE